MKVVARAAVAAADWDAVVATSPDAWLFAASSWLDMIEGVEPWGLDDRSFAVELNGRLVAVMPLHFLAASRRLASSGWGWIGPVLSASLRPGEQTKTLDFMYAVTRAVGEELGCESIEIATPAVTQRAIAARWGVSPFARFGFEDRSTVTQVIDLAPDEEALWAGLSQDARYQIRLARKRGYTAVVEPWQGMVDAYYKVHAEAYARSSLPPHPKAYFDGFADRLASTGHIALTVGRDPVGRPVAFHNTVRFNGGAIYTTGCGETEHRDAGIEYLTFWTAMLAAKAAGARWYEAGEVHAEADDPKLRGLSTFKTKFGGEPHRYFRGRLSLRRAAAVAQATPPRRAALGQWIHATQTLLRAVLSRESAMVPAHSPLPQTEALIKKTYASGQLYATNRICAEVDATSSEFVQVLLRTKLELVRQHYRDGLVVDLCCAAGSHLISLGDAIERGLGVDFAERYLHHARANAPAEKLAFVCGDAKKLPVAPGSVALVYSFSSLYAIPGVGEVIAEIGRVLRQGGIAVLDLGNSRSLNAYCIRTAYKHWPPIFPIAVGEMRRLCAANGLNVRVHRSFQILPLWAGAPRWLWPLLHPAWKRLLQCSVGGKMLDEWVSSLPLVRNFAFRHVLVCEKG